MKYIKTYEIFNVEIGEYVILDEKSIRDYPSSIIKFLISNIGKCFYIGETDKEIIYHISYNSVPKELFDYNVIFFQEVNNINGHAKHHHRKNTDDKYFIALPDVKFKYHDKNKKKLEIYINKIKYNL